LAANSLHAFFGLLAVFPILGLALLVGGVTGREFGRLTLVFLVTLFFSLSLGILVSAVASEARHAITLAFLWLVFFAGVLPAVWWLQWTLIGNVSLDFLLWPSPVFTYLKGFDSGYLGSGAREFWQSLGTLFGLGVGGIILANIILPRAWQSGRRETAGSSQDQERPKLITRAGTRFHPTERWADAMYWLAARDGSPRRVANRALLFLMPIWAIALGGSLTGGSWFRQLFLTALFVSYGLHLVVKVLIASEAGRRMNEDRRAGAWELLLVTPVEVGAILSGQWKALLKNFWPAMLGLCLINAAMIMAVFVFSHEMQMDGRDHKLFGEMFGGGMVSLIFDFFGLCWLGMWRGLNARQHHRAVLATIGQIMGPQWLMFFFLILLEPNVNGDNGVMIVMAMWFGVGIVVDLISGIIAQKRLKTEFRSAVLGGFHA